MPEQRPLLRTQWCSVAENVRGLSMYRRSPVIWCMYYTDQSRMKALSRQQVSLLNADLCYKLLSYVDSP